MKNAAGNKSTVEVHLQPGARSNEIVALRDGVLYAKVTAPPRKGAANRALLELLAQTLSMPKNTLDLIRGHTSRSKVVAIDGLNQDELKERLAQALARKESLQI